MHNVLDLFDEATSAAIQSGTNTEDLTPKIQGLIDQVARDGGGKIILPRGIYRVGGLVFPNDTPIEFIGERPPRA